MGVKCRGAGEGVGILFEGFFLVGFFSLFSFFYKGLSILQHTVVEIYFLNMLSYFVK